MAYRAANGKPDYGLLFAAIEENKWVDEDRSFSGNDNIGLNANCRMCPRLCQAQQGFFFDKPKPDSTKMQYLRYPFFSKCECNTYMFSEILGIIPFGMYKDIAIYLCLRWLYERCTNAEERNSISRVQLREGSCVDVVEHVGQGETL
jgi:hypothetical protein